MRGRHDRHAFPRPDDGRRTSGGVQCRPLGAVVDTAGALAVYVSRSIFTAPLLICSSYRSAAVDAPSDSQWTLLTEVLIAKSSSFTFTAPVLISATNAEPAGR